MTPAEPQEPPKKVAANATEPAVATSVSAVAEEATERGATLNDSASRPVPFWALGLALLTLVVFAFANSVGGAPIFDDFFLVVQIDCFRTMEGMLRILSFDQSYTCAYRPIRFLSYGIDHALFGGAFWGYHVGNIARHVVVTLVVVGLTRLLFVESGVPRREAALWALAIAALWALHPLQTDSVSYVSGRRDILVGGWTMAAVWAAIVASKRGGLWWLLPMWATLLGFLSKESAVVVPALFLLWTLRSASFLPWLKQNVGIAIAVGAGLGLSFVLVLYRGVFASHSNRHLEWWGGSVETNFATVAALQVHYVRHVFLSHPLIGDYQAETIAISTGVDDPRAWIGLALVIVLLGTALWCRARRPLIAFGILWYFVALAPMSHILPHHELFAEHYLYTPLLGALIALAECVRWGIERAPDRDRWTRVARWTCAVLLGVMVLQVRDRNRDFISERAYYERVVEVAPNNRRAVANLGYIYAGEGEHLLAVRWLSRLSEHWVAGSNDERNALMQVVNSARTASTQARAAQDTDMAAQLNALAQTSAAQLAANHPDIGAGHRALAELALERGDFSAVWDPAWRYVELTRGDAGARLLGFAVGQDSARGVEDAERVAALLQSWPDPPEQAVVMVGVAFRRAGAAERALSWLEEQRREGFAPAYDGLRCDVARSIGAPSPGCE
ncbi:MAG: hypothetical protein ACJA1R_001137 [Flavobacteriales bacterium]